MKRILSVPFLLLAFCVSEVQAQVRKQPSRPASKPASSQLPAGKKYPSLLWEISGNGLKKPSWLFGTMHVSNKLAFNLGDSFYNAIRRVDVVALETNPETWQDDYTLSMKMRRKGQKENRWSSAYSQDWEIPTQTMNIASFAIDSYEEIAKAALALEPSMINGLLYRSYGGNANDFEENTFLDMHIFQVGRKLGKKIRGVEDFEESEKLVAEAYRDAEKDKNRKKKSYDYQGINTNPKKLEDAYRDGDLDLLDSLQAINVQSDAFQEKFLYKRNEIQAKSIDSILHKSSLFVGVGAAHLPGKRGVIEMLRDMGYTLRPVIMRNRHSLQRDQLDKARVEHAFQQQTSEDGFYKVAIPGKKFYQFTNIGGFDVVQFADLVNGAYYLVTRVKTNSIIWGDDPSKAADKIDAALYENIPGKILKKTAITKNGYPGFDILNRTRRGDTQRYQIFFTPFEMIIFKMSGNGEYVNTGTEAARFFNSIVLKENPQTQDWINFQPPTGGFSIMMPHQPGILRDMLWSNARVEYSATDKKEGNSYLVIKSNLQNYNHFEEDSFELSLMDESYQYSEFIKTRITKQFTNLNGYPALNCVYQHKDNSFTAAKFVIQGANYYTILVRYKKLSPSIKNFLGSFTIKPNLYPSAVIQTDTVMNFTVKTPIPLSTMDNKEADMYRFLKNLRKDDDDKDELEDFRDKTLLIGNDTVGEKIWITYSQYSNRAFNKDSLGFWKNIFTSDWNEDSSFLISSSVSQRMPDGSRVYDLSMTDTGSSKLLLTRVLCKDGHMISFSSLTDTITRKTELLENFYQTFALVPNPKINPLLNKKASDQVKELFSKDSSIARKAARKYRAIYFDSTDVTLLKEAIDSLNWTVLNYMAIKRQFISSLGDCKDPSIVPWLTQLYWKVKDTADLQKAILSALLKQKTKQGFLAFKELLMQEPPLTSDFNDAPYEFSREDFTEIVTYGASPTEVWNAKSKWPGLYDSLALSRLLFPEMLQFLDIDDYKNETLSLLYTLSDSGYIKGADYESSLNKLYLDGKMLLKKQRAAENKIRMNKMAEKDRALLYNSNDPDDEEEAEEAMEVGNERVDRYSVLLLPFRNKHQGVQNYFQQLMTTEDNRLLYNSFILLLRNDQPVPDSLFNKFAALDKYRTALYTDLKKMNKLNKFPAAWKNQQSIVRSQMLGEIGYFSKPDSIVFLDALPVKYKGKEGLVYFYKYKKMRDDDSWALAVAGMQPLNKDSVSVVEDDDFMQPEGRVLENDQPVEEQLKKVLKEMLVTLHPNAAAYYEPRKYSKYKTLFSEMVKDRRYRD